MKKQVLALSLLLALSSASSAFAAAPKTLRIGTDPTYAPFESKNAQGQLVGFDIDLANEICKRMETKCTYVESDFDALIPSLKAKKIDAIISSLSITEKRQMEIAFSEKLYAANARLIAPKGSKIMPTLDSLKGKTIGLLQGTTQETYANENWRPKGITVTPYANQDLVYQDLTAGRIDAAFQDEVAASEGFLKQPAGKGFAFAGPAVKDEKIFGVGTGMGMRKDDADLKAAIDKAFDSMRKDGTYDKLAKKYFDFDVYGG
ncbi:MULTISPECIES: lysine/arginine/ornithine ABC transporter substrate-binding protein ArgT [Erwinia]|jgi:histidine transport system substrate-binding protein|uniref:Lysine/arginine/ornithine ABC transporter, substrate-binding protein n=1 Tax=Erwinia billingiae (strain Eb661) TaxID=634500 RepID=D8MUX7_ERWBE|nr:MULTISPECIES: lysine/arginine/ornithine ABC transporter substrate-binding protein ArgT [Erwinia]MBN7122968.1 histidine ABC transporter substrate-binding protein HisJ [Erwinia billingiae]MCX0501152.1 lysine/arginine/ornithine ABC transporter substrate-binding protein ArgT [Erwinia billingiae]PRB57987.1 lysine/arginine/ornithine ABC transporter substrate-binding protein ArgT [Erwinia billingiae]QBR52597.1 lysine/arginine/ornithine ABC transporter substrate-binding protein ArgT [Erwinia sp. QL-